MKRKLTPILLGMAAIMLCCTLPAFSQDKTVAGKVTDSKDGSGIQGASITVKGAKTGTQTDATGAFSLSVPANATTLIISAVGFGQKEVAIGSGIVAAALESTTTNLNEVVVVGYGTARKKDLTGSVSSVKAKDFNGGVIGAPDQLLQNKVPGLEITNNSGQPGAATTVKIRGNTSIRASNNPLYVIDGVPLDGRSARPAVNLGNNGLGFGTTPDANPLLYINPNDIAQIDVLKDASSAAIYGSRGANGVIVISTKKGGIGTKIDVGANWGTASYMKKYKVLDAGEFRSALTKYDLGSKYDSGSSVDALKEISQSKLSQNYNLAVSGGNESGKFRASFFGSSLNGLLKKSSLDRYLASFNGQYKFLDKRLSIDFNLIAGHVTENLTNVSNTAGSTGNLISAALSWNPTVPFRDKSGKYILNSNGTANPLALSDAFGDISNVNSILGNISAGLKITKDLEYKFLYAINHSTGQRNVNIEGFLEGFPSLSGQGYAVIATAALTSETFTHTLNYRTNFTKDLIFDAVAGYEYWKTKYSNNTVAGSGFNTNLDQSNRIDMPYTSTFQDAKTQYPYVSFVDPTVDLQSYFARVNFNLSDKYFLTATIRADGSSKFGTNNKYGYFPSVGVKWQISNENFMKGSNTFSNLALRASWGLTGNQEFPAGSSQAQFALTSFNNVGQIVVANPDLKWETTSSINIGADFAFMKGKIYASVDFYNKDTKDILFQSTAIQPAPASIYFINLPAHLINKGVELGLGATVVDHKNFTWDLNFNIAYNKNKLQDFFDVNTGKPLTIQTGQINGQGVSGTLAQVITNEQPVNEFNLKEFSGFDTHGTPMIAASPTYAGDPNPHYLLGFGTSLRYQKVTLSINTGGAMDYLIYNNTATSVTNVNGITSGRNIDVEAYNSAEDKSSGAAASTRFLEKGDYFKLRNATIRYDIGNVGKYIKTLSAFVSGTNLFVITKFHGFDPEVNVDKNNNNYPSRSIEYIPYPTPRTLSFGVNFSL